MLTINGKEITCYKDYAALTGNDLISFMKTQSAEDIEAFKVFASTPQITHYKDGETKERKPNFFELRNWVLERYEPGITAAVAKKKATKTLIDQILEL